MCYPETLTADERPQASATIIERPAPESASGSLVPAAVFW